MVDLKPHPAPANSNEAEREFAQLIRQLRKFTAMHRSMPAEFRRTPGAVLCDHWLDYSERLWAAYDDIDKLLSRYPEDE